MRAILDLVFPSSCLSCGARGAVWLCGACEDTVPWITTGCARCGRPAARDTADCKDCRAPPPAFRRARAAAVYAGPARDALKAYKIGGERRSAKHFAGAMGGATAELDADVVTFVPSTRLGRSKRGFDPAEELALHVARMLGKPKRRLLRKVRETADQASLDASERRRNLRGAFEARHAAGAVLLVDDIFTTGATARECAATLASAGIPQIDVLTFARAL